MKENYLPTLIRDIKVPWSLERFQIPHGPHILGELEHKAEMVMPTPSIINMPVKDSQSGLVLPKTVIGREGEEVPFDNPALWEFVDRSLRMEEEINPYFASSYAYLTIDQRIVEPGHTQRDSGIHIDGMQGDRYPTKRPPCHLYAVANTAPTRFYDHPLYLTNLDQGTDNFYIHIDEQSRNSEPIVPPAFAIAFFTAYNAHESPIITGVARERTFYRLEFTQKDPYGGTRNNMLPDFPYGDRSLSENLAKQRKEKSKEAPRS